MNIKVEDLIVGICLGDVSISNNHSIGTSRLQITHGYNSLDYVNFKLNILKYYTNYTSPSLRNGRYPSWYFNTRTLRCLYNLTKDFKADVRTIPNNIGDLITPASLAVWFMDDGCSSNTSGRRVVRPNPYSYLCTDRYSKEEVEHLVDVLRCLFDIKATVKNSKSMGNRCRIYIGTYETPKFYNIIYPYIIPSMMYKLKM